MGSTHLIGHRVKDLSFQKHFVECDCGEVIKTEPHDTPAIDQERLFLAFGKHRKEEMVKQGLPPNL